MAIKEELAQAIDYLKKELAKIRAGRASIELVEGILIDAYNTKMPLNQLATLSSPEPRLIVIQPWDKAVLKDIERALRDALHDMNPVADSDAIRLPFPAPTEERRRELAREVGKIVEDARVRIRRVREDALQELKQREEKKEISEDDLFRKKEEMQRLVDACNGQAEEMGRAKERDIMEV